MAAITPHNDKKEAKEYVTGYLVEKLGGIQYFRIPTPFPA